MPTSRGLASWCTYRSPHIEAKSCFVQALFKVIISAVDLRTCLFHYCHFVQISLQNNSLSYSLHCLEREPHAAYQTSDKWLGSSLSKWSIFHNVFKAIQYCCIFPVPSLYSNSSSTFIVNKSKLENVSIGHRCLHLDSKLPYFYNIKANNSVNINFGRMKIPSCTSSHPE